MKPRPWLAVLALAFAAACADDPAPAPQAPSADVSKPEEKTVPAGSPDSSIVPGTKTEAPGTTTEVITPPAEGEAPPPAPPPPAAPPPTAGGEASPLLLKHPCSDRPELCMPMKKLLEIPTPVNPEVKGAGVVNETAVPKAVTVPNSVDSHTLH